MKITGKKAFFMTLALIGAVVSINGLHAEEKHRIFSEPRFKLKNNTDKSGGTNEPLKFRLISRYNPCYAEKQERGNTLPKKDQPFQAGPANGRYDNCQYLVYEAVIEPGGEAYYDFSKGTGYEVNTVEVYKKNAHGQWPEPGAEPLRQASGTWQKVKRVTPMGIHLGYWHGVAQVQPEKGDQYKLTVGYRS